MALKVTIQAILAHLATINVVTADAVTVPLFARLWNNQVDYVKQGQLQVFQTPAVFLEWITNEGGNMGQNYNGNDVTLRFHLVHQNYNTEGSFEQDLVIFDLRDTVCALLNRHKYIHLSPLQKVTESQDTSHDNVYHYIIDYNTHFVDTLDDAISEPLTVSVPPLTIRLDRTVYLLDSYAVELIPSNCDVGLLDFFNTISFSTGNFFANGTKIKLDVSSTYTIMTYNLLSPGATFDDNTMELTITDTSQFTNIEMQITVSNPVCADSGTLTIFVDSYTGLINGSAGTQQILTQTYTPL